LSQILVERRRKPPHDRGAARRSQWFYAEVHRKMAMPDGLRRPELDAQLTLRTTDLARN
jgi:hypothetical protein